MKLKDFFSHLAVGLTVWLIGPSISTAIATLGISRILKGGWTSLWDNKIYWIVTLLIFVVFVIVFVRVRKISAQNKSWAAAPMIAQNMTKVGKMNYKNLVWDIMMPERGLSFDEDDEIFVKIKTPPRCPECKTRIKEKKSFLGWYYWKCCKPDCPFWQISFHSYYYYTDDLEKTAEREVEKKRSKRKY